MVALVFATAVCLCVSVFSAPRTVAAENDALCIVLGKHLHQIQGDEKVVVVI